MITFKVEKPEEFAEESIALCKSWWYDSVFYKQFGIDYDVRVETFKGLEDSILAVVGRDENKKIAAIYVGIISPFVFNPAYTYAHEIVWHVRKDLQKTGVAAKLLKAVETVTKYSGIDLWGLAVPNDARYLNVQDGLKYKGFALQDYMYMKMNRKD